MEESKQLYVILAHIINVETGNSGDSVCDVADVVDVESGLYKLRPKEFYISAFPEHLLRTSKISITRGLIKRLPVLLADRLLESFHGDKFPYYSTGVEAYEAIQHSGVRIHT